ncbi:nephrin-like isoform X1 [Mercenaria mercenaria]|uniref:nephrin-like isoform X1 n=1 Tax=Mercenaria mercenaria TaxID=6596 RepID=UPI00234E5766|nr:nephrin-like isoform X1 [Mercenaria mercenaria]
MTSEMIICILLYVFCGNEMKGAYTNTVYLSPAKVVAVENTSVTLTCSKTNGPLLETRWSNSQIEHQNANLYLNNGQCTMTRFLKDSDLFDGICNGNGTYSVLLKRVDRLQHVAIWRCREVIEYSNGVTINALVPVSSVEITPLENRDDTIMENTSTTFQCKASASRPVPTISWFLRNPSYPDLINITNETRQSHLFTYSDTELTEVISILNYTFNRNFNGWFIYCVASNLPSRNVTSTKNELNISFPPDGQPTITGIKHDSIYRIVENEQGTLSCSVTGGNPVATLKWQCFNSNVSDIRKNRSVTSNVTWTAQRYQHNKSCKCVSKHAFGENTVSVIVAVLYPPDTPRFRIGDDYISRVVQMVQNNSLILVCETNSNPDSEYSWNNKIPGQILSVSSVQNQDAGDYICNVNNTMIDSHGVTYSGSNTASITLQLLSPAKVGNMTNITINEGRTFNITCPVIPGNSLITSVIWSSGGAFVASNSRIIYIPNISRDDDRIYICSIKSKMIPSIGPTVEQITHGQFHLIVNYKASVLQFYVGGSTEKNNYTVNETDNVTFWCNIESKPQPNISISHNGKVLHVSVGNNSVAYTRNNIQCNDFGKYICSGMNEYNNGTPSARNLTINVNCSPRPSPFVELRKRVNGLKHFPATLRFTALAFPEPGPSGFTWYYLNGSSRITLTNSHNVAISSLFSQSRLTIINVTQSNYGQYFLRIANPHGVFEQRFILEPYVYSTYSCNLADSLNTGAFLGVGFGTFVTTLFIVGSVLVVYKYMRRRHKKQRSGHNTQCRYTERTTSSTKKNKETIEHEQIAMSQAEIRVSAAINGEAAEENDSTPKYEELDMKQKDRDQYSQLPALYEKTADVTRCRNTDMIIKNTETSRDIQDYINIRI